MANQADKLKKEFDKLKIESLAANAVLADHVDAEHPRAEVRVSSHLHLVGWFGFKSENLLLL